MNKPLTIQDELEILREYVRQMQYEVQQGPQALRWQRIKDHYRLSSQQTRVLRALYEHEACNHEYLLLVIGSVYKSLSRSALTVVVCYLRKKLGRQAIVSVWGSSYVLSEQLRKEIDEWYS